MCTTLRSSCAVAPTAEWYYAAILSGTLKVVILLCIRHMPLTHIYFRYTYKTNFLHLQAREHGQSQCKWVIVNVQNVQEFSCQQLNRDVWSDSTVKSIVQESFVFWQVRFKMGRNNGI